MKILASGWEKTFTRRMPMVMASFSRNASTPLRKFHRDIEARARQVGSSIAGLHMLENQVSAYESILKDLSNATKEYINATQRDINREFTPVIEQAMATAYEQCVEERGKCRTFLRRRSRLMVTGSGSFARMKAAMNSHVAHERHTSKLNSKPLCTRHSRQLRKPLIPSLPRYASKTGSILSFHDFLLTHT